MTIIATAHAGDGWFIGSDTSMTIGGDPTPIGGKWVLGDGFALGISGSSRAFALARENLTDLAKNPTPWGIANAWRKSLIADGFVPMADGDSDKGGPPRFNATAILVLHAHGIWHICSSQTPTRVERRFLAIGAGGEIAHGAMWSAARETMSAERIVRDGVSAAIQLSGGCYGPAWIHRLGDA